MRCAAKWQSDTTLGELPAALGKLTQLRDLNVYGNMLSGTVRRPITLLK